MTSAQTSSTSVVAIITIAAIAACASSPRHAPVEPIINDTHAADAELARGCFDCVVAARDAYTKAHDLKGELEANLILAIRAKELGLRGSTALVDAHHRDHELADAPRIFHLVAAIPDESVAPHLRGSVRLEAKKIEEDRRWLYHSSLTPIVRDYLALALDCAFEPLAGVPPVRTSVPLLAYRKEICGFGRISALADIRRAEPRFVETGYAMAMTELAMMSAAGPQHAKQHLDEVHAKFPASTQVTLALGIYLRAVGDFTGALATYDGLLAADPDLADAKLGRVYCLGALGKPREAIELADDLIHDGDYVSLLLPERAAQYRQLSRLDMARTSIDMAKDLSPQPQTLQLAGIIEYEQNDLVVAKADLELVRDADDGDCTSRWYLGLVEAKRGDADAATAAFGDANACYRQRSARSLARVAELGAQVDLDPAYRDSQVTTLAASSKADLAQAAVGETILERIAKSQHGRTKRRDK